MPSRITSPKLYTHVIHALEIKSLSDIKLVTYLRRQSREEKSGTDVTIEIVATSLFE